MGCTTLIDLSNYVGKIVFVDRGSCDYGVKANRAAAAGAIGVIIGNALSTQSTAASMGNPTSPEPTPTLPALCVS